MQRGDSTWPRPASPLELLEALQKRNRDTESKNQLSGDPEIDSLVQDKERPTAPMGLVASLDELNNHPTMKSLLTTMSKEAFGATAARQQSRSGRHHTESGELLAAGSLVGCVAVICRVVVV